MSLLKDGYNFITAKITYKKLHFYINIVFPPIDVFKVFPIKHYQNSLSTQHSERLGGMINLGTNSWWGI